MTADPSAAAREELDRALWSGRTLRGLRDAASPETRRELVDTIVAAGWRPTTRCVNDTNGDGDCAACARNPDAPCRQPLVPLPDSETEWGWRPSAGDLLHVGDHVRGGFTEAYARERVAGIPGARVLVRREVGPWTEVQP